MSYDKEIFAKATDILATRRQNAKFLEEQHVEIIRSKIPQIIELRFDLANTSVELSKLILAGSDQVLQMLELLKNSNLENQVTQKRLLTQNGFSADFLDTQYTCKICKDSGYSGAQRCVCLINLLSELSSKKLSETVNLASSNFENFTMNYYLKSATDDGSDAFENMSKVYKYCQIYARDFTKHSQSVFMLGGTGLGKTHLSLAIANQVIQRGFSVIYGTAQGFLRKIEREHFGRESDDIATLETLVQVDLLILDDLGSEYDSSFYSSTIYNIINSRINAELPTIINTNLTPQELENKYSQRVTSRLFTMYTVLRFFGKDIRLQKKQNGFTS